MKRFRPSKPELFYTLKGYNKQKFTADLMAGIIVGIVALPLASPLACRLRKVSSQPSSLVSPSAPLVAVVFR